MIWILLAFLTALFASLKNVFSKHGLKNVDEYVVSWAFRFFPTILLLPVFFLIGVPEIKPGFWLMLVIGVVFITTTTILLMKALKYSDISIVAPMTAFTPLFMLITSPLITKEFPSVYGLLGVLLIVIGSYVLNIKERKKSYFWPLKALIKEKGAQYMLIVAFIWSIGSNVDKIGVLNSSPLFWVVATNGFAALILFPIMLKKSSVKIKSTFKFLKFFVGLGLLVVLGQIFQMTAITLTQVIYVITIKRTSIIMSVIFGYLIFKEKGFKERIFGSVLMLLGIVFITLA